MDKPACYNRPPAAATRLVQDGWKRLANGLEVRNMVTIRDDMSKCCQQWGELGEARLRNWNCEGCRWKDETE